MHGGAPLNGVEDMARRLNEAMRDVDDKVFHMKKAIEKEDLDAAIKYAAEMLEQLRAGNLSPKMYYDLWMVVFEKLGQLHAYFEGSKSLADVYERVQSTAKIVPRLYLMITAGSGFLLSREAPSQDILVDMIEMAKGVQHPMRGLFLRDYLLRMAQGKLTGEDVTLEFAINFLLQNFAEMNRLWVRMQKQVTSRNRVRREKERQHLAELISHNLHRLSNLPGMTLEVYQALVLPKVLEIITNCKDTIAQQLLLDVVLQVFPSSFHVASLTELLGSFEHLEADVDVKVLLAALLKRIQYVNDEDDEEGEGAVATTENQDGATNDGDGDDAVEQEFSGKKTALSEASFEIIFESIGKTITARAETMKNEDLLNLQIALVEFAVTCYPDELQFVQRILGMCAEHLGAAKEPLNEDDDVSLMQLLRVPLSEESSVPPRFVLAMPEYGTLKGLLTPKSQQRVAHVFLEYMLKLDDRPVDTVEDATTLLAFVEPLVAGATQEKQKASLAKLVHCLHADDPTLFAAVLALARKHLREPFTMAPFAYRYLALAAMVELAEQRKVFQTVHEIASELAEIPEWQETAMRLFLQAATAADYAEQVEVAYEFFAQAFTMYEDIADTKSQLRTLPVLVGSLQRTANFDAESYDTLCTKCTQYANRMLKKEDKCAMLLLCTHLFWAKGSASKTDGERTRGLLEKARKVADSSMASAARTALLVEILNRYVHFFDAGLDLEPQSLAELIQLVQTDLDEAKRAGDAAEDDGEGNNSRTREYFENTLRHLHAMKDKDPVLYGELFRD